MTKNEIELLRRFLEASDAYFEFGMGGSTCFAAQLVRSKIYAVDSDPSWIEKVDDIILEPSKDVKLLHVDIGRTEQWGYPVDRRPRAEFDEYSKSILDRGTFDLCLVDGRFRIACFLQAISSLPSDSIVGMHDYRDRADYHLIEEFARPICKADQLYFFVKRPGVDMSKLNSMLDKYRRIID